jgi:hypothetical protein
MSNNGMALRGDENNSTAVFHVPEAHPEIYEKTMGDGIFRAETQRAPRKELTPFVLRAFNFSIFLSEFLGKSWFSLRSLRLCGGF